jgi:hypothetical protein
VNVSLFPFLAVLICTMGALILLLVVIAEQTRRNVVAAAEIHQAESVHQQTARLSDVAQRLTQQRDELIAALARHESANAVLRSATVAAEDERARLADELAARTSLDDDSDKDRRASLLAEIAELDHRIAKSRGERERFAGIAQRGSKSFAVVPYQGNYGTRRRPLYIECTASSVILQPEGVLIDPADLETPFGKTNPLGHAIESASDHLLRLQHTDAGKPGIPYPLLLVRPGGIENFYLARRALQATTNEFGYELIEGDWELDYPEVDPELALVMSDAVKNARRAQLHLARSAPRLRRSSPFGEYTGDGGSGYGGNGDGASGDGGSGDGASGNGPDETSGDAADADDSLPGTALPDKHFGGSGTLSGAVGSGSLARASAANTTTGTGDTGIGGDGLTPSGASFSPTASGTSGSGTGGGSGSGGGQLRHDAFSFDNAPVATGPSASQPSFGDTPTSASSSSGGAPGPQLVAPDQAGGSTGNGSSGSSSAVTPSASGYAADMAAGGAARADASSGTGSPGGGSTNSVSTPGANMSAGSSAAGAHDINNGSSQSSLGRTRGTDNRDSGKSGDDTGEQPWALPNTASGAVPVTRPIRVRIDADRIALLSPDGRHERQVVRFGDNARDAVGDVVSAVWDCTESWGLAGRGLYWSPVLVADVAPNGFGRLEQLQRMLTGSGIELKPRAAPKSAARPVPEKRWLR